MQQLFYICNRFVEPDISYLGDLMKVSYFLLPFAILYGIGLRFRNFLFDNGILSVTGFEYPIISVGNLAVGGTGKTPHVEYLIRLLKKEFHVATLSRGYGRKSKGFHIIKPTMAASRAGDEPLQFKNKFPDIKVAVGEKRVPAMMSLLATYPDTNVVIMDDAYQHRAIKPGLSILLTDFNDLFTRDYLLPMGTLREERRNMKRAHMVIVTKTPYDATEETIRRIRFEIKTVPPQALFFTNMKYGGLVAVNDCGPALTIPDLQHQQVVAFSGLAKSRGFLAFLKKNAKSTFHFRFHDHHAYTKKDLHSIRNKFTGLNGENKLIITTEKDWMRIVNEPVRKIFEGLPVYTLQVFVDFVDQREKELFNDKILNYVEKNQPYRIYNRK